MKNISVRKKDWFPNRFSCIPIGVSQWHGHLVNIEKIFKEQIGFEDETSLVPKNIDNEKDIFILSNFRAEKYPIRNEALKHFKKNFANKKKCFFDHVSDYEHIMLNKRSKFVVSPPGNGVDCYRHYESIFMNAIPIIVSSSLDEIFHDLPVLIVESYLSLNVSFLEQQFDLIRKKKNYNYQKLYVGYWRNLIHSKIFNFY